MATAAVGPLVDVFILLTGAQLMGWAFQKLKQPGVIGEVIAGIILGPLLVLAVGEPLVHGNEILDFVAELGAIFLLFLIGIEVRLSDLLAIGPEAAVVATVGVIIPFGAGYAAGVALGYALVPSLFLGTALVATSVGITARVLRELDVLTRPFSRVILGAALIDDVLGLVVLAIVSGIAVTGSFDPAAVGTLLVSSAVFIALALAAVPLIRRIDLDRLPFRNPVQFAVVLGVGFAAVSAVIGLAPIVGAFFAGMVLAEVKDEHPIEEAAEGLSTLLTPVFFAVIGLELDLIALSDPTTILIGTGLTVLAVVGKLVGGLGSIKRGIRQASVVGMGMVPRGEVGLIVAGIGLSVGAVDAAEYAVVLFVVVATTLLAPLLLRPLIAWADAGDAGDPPAPEPPQDPVGHA